MENTWKLQDVATLEAMVEAAKLFMCGQMEGQKGPATQAGAPSPIGGTSISVSVAVASPPEAATSQAHQVGATQVPMAFSIQTHMKGYRLGKP